MLAVLETSVADIETCSIEDLLHTRYSIKTALGSITLATPVQRDDYDRLLALDAAAKIRYDNYVAEHKGDEYVFTTLGLKESVRESDVGHIKQLLALKMQLDETNKNFKEREQIIFNNEWAAASKADDERFEMLKENAKRFVY